MSEKDDILEMRSLIPEFDCIPGCTDCCGIVPFSNWEWNNILLHKQHKTFDCPYIAGDDGGCSIYADRPIPCRIYGTVPRLTCPHGRGPKEMIEPGQEKRLMEMYLKYKPKASETTLKGLSQEQIYFILHSEP